MLGTIGFERRFDYAVIGTVPMLQARELLSPVCGWLQKGYFDTLDDLKEAKALFDA
jgi:hypothetical protein